MYIDGVVIKIASRCNLNCTYCYMYNKGDKTYLKQPKKMDSSTYLSFFSKLKNYLEKYNKKNFAIIFHGGEPMLVGKDFIKEFIIKIKELIKNVDLVFCIQTNGVLIDKDWAIFFNEMDIKVGVSIDATKEGNDNFRVYRNGKSAYNGIVNGIRNLQVNNVPFGVLSVIDINETARKSYEHYKRLGIKHLNLLYPDDNYTENFKDDLKLGKWLSDFFDIWVEDKNDIYIRQFEALVSLILGYNASDEYYGLSNPNTFILETDGEMQANDPIRVCKNGFSKTKLNINENEIDELYELPLSFMYYNNHKNICEKCNKCTLRNICGSGYIINRYSTKNGFDNPSIYCKSLAYFITHVQNYLLGHLDNKIVSKYNIEPLIFNELLPYLEDNEYLSNQFLQSFK